MRTELWIIGLLFVIPVTLASCAMVALVLSRFVEPSKPPGPPTPSGDVVMVTVTPNLRAFLDEETKRLGVEPCDVILMLAVAACAAVKLDRAESEPPPELKS